MMYILNFEIIILIVGFMHRVSSINQSKYFKQDIVKIEYEDTYPSTLIYDKLNELSDSISLVNSYLCVSCWDALKLLNDVLTV